MQQCKQTDSQSVYEHGLSVYSYLTQLLDYLDNKSELDSWKLPQWLKDYKSELKASLLPFSILELYTIFHDCGKPYCLTYDDQGKRHFPNHAQASHDAWLNVGGSEQVAKLMLMDMEVHTMKAEQIEEFVKNPEAISLLLVSLCEVHSNASMFGGIESTSFKIKWKQIDKRGKQICQLLFGGKNESET